MLLKVLLTGFLALSSSCYAKPIPLEQVLEAAGKGNLLVLQKYKKSEGDLNAQDSHGLTALMQAVATGQKRAVDYLLQQKVNLELQNENGDTALAMAIGNEQDDIAVTLINAGANTAVLGGENKNNLTFMAASVNATKTLTLLAEKNPEQLRQKNKNGETPLHEGARFGSDKTIGILLKANAPKHLKNNEGQTPLDIAKSIGNESAVKLLK